MRCACGECLIPSPGLSLRERNRIAPVVNVSVFLAACTEVVSFAHTERPRRRISAGDIERAVGNGAIIENYPQDPRGPSCLVLGHSGKRPIHVVCGRLSSEEILIITACQPDPEEWESDWATRRR
jgi:hypothetical protein